MERLRLLDFTFYVVSGSCVQTTQKPVSLPGRKLLQRDCTQNCLSVLEKDLSILPCRCSSRRLEIDEDNLNPALEHSNTC